jgi:hypothetical protein
MSRRRGRAVPMPHSPIEAWDAAREFEEDMEAAAACDIRNAPAREVLRHAQRLLDWSVFYTRRGMTQAARELAKERAAWWGEMIPLIMDAVERDDARRIH